MIIPGWLSEDVYGKPCARHNEVLSMAGKYLQQFKIKDLTEDFNKAQEGLEIIRKAQASFTNTKK